MPPGRPLPLPSGDGVLPPLGPQSGAQCGPAMTGAAAAVCPQPPDEYCLMWVIADLISFTLIVGIFVLQK